LNVARLTQKRLELAKRLGYNISAKGSYMTDPKEDMLSQDDQKTSQNSPLDRREFVCASALVGASVAGMVAAVAYDRGPTVRASDPKGSESIRDLTALQNLPLRDREDVIVRMQRELGKAMAKPIEERRWVMVIDTRKCVGCDACTVGCIAENKLPPGVVYRPVIKEEFGEFPNIQLRFTASKKPN